MSDDDLQIFPSLAPDAPDTPTIDASVSTTTPPGPVEEDDILLEGLPQSERDKVVSAWARLEAVETSYPGTLAICMTSVARAHVRAAKESVKAMQDVPDKITKSANAVNMAAENNDRLIQEVSSTSKDLKESAKSQQESQQYTEKMSRWTFALCLAGVVIFVLCLGVLVGTWVAAEKAANLTEVAKKFEASTEQIRKMQFVTNSRLLLQADENQMQSEWRKLQMDVSRNNNQQSEEHQQRLERLKTWKGEIDARWIEQNEKEKQALQR